MTRRPLSEEELAQQAEVDPSFVRRALISGALQPKDVHGFASDAATRCRFLKAWDSAGLPVEIVGELVARGEIQFSFLGAPFLAAHPRLPQSYAELSHETGIDLATLKGLHEAIGFDPPDTTDPARADDRLLIDWTRDMLSAGFSKGAIFRLARVYSAGLRRMAIAEAEGYEAEVEDELRAAGASEQDLFATGGRVGERLPELFESIILTIYRRHRQHVWLDHSVGHVEIILESKGLFERLDRPPCVCFVDLTGFTRLTEEGGDRVAAEVAARLESLVGLISHRFEGRPVRWLGDGGMFVFREPAAAVEAARNITSEASDAGLPPTHIGIHCGPVVFQDGDIYGRTVNIASRLSALAGAGEIVVSADIAQRVGVAHRFEPMGDVELKGVAGPLVVYRVGTSTSDDGQAGTLLEEDGSS